MNWTAVGAISELMAAVAVVASLLYLAAQVRHNTRQIRLSAQQAVVHELGNAMRAQAQSHEWAELLMRGLADLSSLNGVERTRFLSHIGHILRLYEASYFHYREGTLDKRVWRGFERAMSDVMAYPGMQAAWDLRRHHLSDEFAVFLDHLGERPDARPIFGEYVRAPLTEAYGADPD